MLEIRGPHDEGALALGHLLAAHGEKPVDVHLRRQAEAGRLQHAGPKERMEVRDIFADEVMNLGSGGRGTGGRGSCRAGARKSRIRLGRSLALPRRPPVFQLLALPFAPLPARGDVADGGVEPDVPIVTRAIGDFEAKVGGGPRHVPIAQWLTEELRLEVVRRFRLQVIAALRPFLEKAVELLNRHE